ncbi:MAG: class I SAM-dependent methyltransferase [Planctomycetes bacterium]|nr:class I SAM-dependent methyltransferase [Planctomycetota bacterium]
MITSPARERDVAAHYDDLDQFYREFWGEHVHHGLWTTGRESPDEAVEKLIDYVAQEARIARGGRVCDVGCGYGATSRYLASRYGAEVTALTISPKQHAYAVAQTGDDNNPTYLLRNWETNGLETASFDGLISIECVSHVEDKPLYFEEIHRVLKPGATAVVVAWLACERPSRSARRRLLEPICSEGRLAGLGNRREYAAMIESAGLRLLSYRDLSRQVEKTWTICLRRVLGKLAVSRQHRKYLWERPTTNWIFLLTLFRIRAAYASGAMRYGVFVMQKP